MSTLKIDSIANRFGFAGETLESWLADPRYSQDQVAHLLGTSPQILAGLLAQPDHAVNAAPIIASVEDTPTNF